MQAEYQLLMEMGPEKAVLVLVVMAEVMAAMVEVMVAWELEMVEAKDQPPL